VVNTMKAHPTSKGVQRCGCCALVKLIFDVATRNHAKNVGVKDVVENAIKAHADDLNVQHIGLAALNNLRQL